jgi:lipoprotein-anchoring transpeptidase ErfK/SrfK
MTKFATALTAAGLMLALLSTAAMAQPNTQAQQGSPVVRVAQMPKTVKPQFKRQSVRLVTTEAPGTIIIDTDHKYLYLVEDKNRATRYGIGVGREGFGWSGVVKIGRKAEWPSWTPPAEMRVREATKGHIIPAFQEGGEDNPLGARAMYLYQGGKDTIFRIHGTNQPWTIGLNMSSGCIRMMNQDVTHLYDRAPVGTKVIVIGPGNKQGEVSFDDRGIDILRTIFGG